MKYVYATVCWMLVGLVAGWTLRTFPAYPGTILVASCLALWGSGRAALRSH